ncbi:MAG: enoyl-CoA hydratase/isomerase family protein [Candidatus Binatia bacterium]
MADTVLVRVDDGLAWITLNRPEVKNAINDEMRDALIAALERVGRDETIRAAVLTAAGDMFCPGADLWSARREGQPETPHPGRARALMRQNSQRLIRTVLETEKPIVAAVNGTAAGMGAHLALACDLVILAAEAKLIEVFARRGIAVDSGGAYLLSRLVPIHRAKELVFFADDLPAAEALRLGLCNRVVPRADLERAAREWGERLAKGPTFALGMSKRLLERAYRADLETCFEEEGMAQSLVAQSEDTHEGMRAFGERRKPEFKGR